MMNKKVVYNWLSSILNGYPEKEIKSICQNCIDDDIAYSYVRNQYKTNKKNYEKQLFHDLNYTKNKSK